MKRAMKMKRKSVPVVSQFARSALLLFVYFFISLFLSQVTRDSPKPRSPRRGAGSVLRPG
jgi:hypothetical protein